MSRAIKWIIIHQSASNNSAHDNIETIRQWHVSERKFKDVGYHYFIRKDGTLEKGRLEDKEGAHAKGHNRGTIGICLSGLFHKTDPKLQPTPEQLNALEVLLIDLCSRHELTRQDILGHADVGATDCPGFDLDKWLRGLSWE
jgi:N-acetylmuramoyl-L-alanine amidase